jgi:hypothetical protein
MMQWLLYSEHYCQVVSYSNKQKLCNKSLIPQGSRLIVNGIVAGLEL